MSNAEIVIYGGGGHAKVVVDCLINSGHQVRAVIDEKYEGKLLGVERLRSLPELTTNNSVVIAIGDNAVRKKLAMGLDVPFSNVVHPSAIVSRFAVVGKGTMVLHGSIVQADVRVGNHVIINTGAQADHDCIIGDFVHLAPGSLLCGGVTIGEGTLVGVGAIVNPKINIGKWAVVGAGAVVIRDIPDYAVAVGNPARIIRYDKSVVPE